MRGIKTGKWAIALAALAVGALTRCAVAGTLIQESEANSCGLTRAWQTQVPVASRGRLEHVTQYEDSMFVQTSTGLLIHLDAETGRTRWSAAIGRSGIVSLAPGISKDRVAVINGVTLSIMDRHTGLLEWDKKLDGTPGAGPVLNDKHVFFPMLTGLMLGYELKNRYSVPWAYAGGSRTEIQPRLSGRTLSWSTENGRFFVADIYEPQDMKIRYRLKTSGGIVTPHAYWTPYLYVATTTGFLYCVDERNGKTAWTYATGRPITTPPAAIEKTLYVVSDRGGLSAINGSNGAEKWYAEKINHFIAASKSRVYASDSLGRLIVLDAASGAMLTSLPLNADLMKISNSQSDRLYVVTRSGLLQCLHETGQDKPTYYAPPAPVIETNDKKRAKAPLPVAKTAGDEATEEPADAGAKAADGEEPAAAEVMHGKAKEKAPADGDDPFAE